MGGCPGAPWDRIQLVPELAGTGGHFRDAIFRTQRGFRVLFGSELPPASPTRIWAILVRSGGNSGPKNRFPQSKLTQTDPISRSFHFGVKKHAKCPKT